MIRAFFQAYFQHTGKKYQSKICYTNRLFRARMQHKILSKLGLICEHAAPDRLFRERMQGQILNNAELDLFRGHIQHKILVGYLVNVCKRSPLK